MRFNLIPAAAASLSLLLTGPIAHAADSWFDTSRLQAEDEEKKTDQEKSEDNATGDEEPECE